MPTTARVTAAGVTATARMAAPEAVSATAEAVTPTTETMTAAAKSAEGVTAATIARRT